MDEVKTSKTYFKQFHKFLTSTQNFAIYNLSELAQNHNFVNIKQ